MLLFISFMPFKHFLPHLETGNDSRSNDEKFIDLKWYSCLPCVYNYSKSYIFQYLHFRFSSRKLGHASTHSCNYYFVQHFTIVTFICHSTTLLRRHNFISRRCQASLMQVDGISTYLYLSGCDIFPLRNFSFYFHRYFMYDLIRDDFRWHFCYK